MRYLKDIVTNPYIEVGEYSYYSGYYSGVPFEDGCVRYAWGDTKSRQLFNPIEAYGWDLDRLIIGNYVCIASGVTILMGGNHNHNPQWVSVYPFETMIEKSFKPKGDTHIKSDSWIGMNAIIMPGVTIGEGAIVAAGSVVSRDVLPYEVVGGNPVKHIKMRFTEAHIKCLLEMRWFDWPQHFIDLAIPLLSSQNIDALYAYYNDTVKEHL